ncbi:MAG: class I SAM-dependent methyltransferase [Candidatus Thiodiazotropha lotti]|nr:class I SAM-dependent methyltransferase [Candidatus Thiodiazotropha lotti]MCG8004372.1 class I SAM-dependent methyltransferase [Candidatus Thiodiazotropha lotti]MCW4187993.1 class I SAM-dependent methyltransferase [Candidatus Thiodiazotropha lotti]MCW4201211.1 class I SAM-dependent methyltransferase [Candidatus Thiodiazotropha lotti]
MYEFIHDIALHPSPFSRYTAKQLWTKQHLAEQMLEYHLSQETDLASRRVEVIDRVVTWINGQIELSGKTLCDLGCGPGLYTKRFSEHGAQVTGIDFSEYSLNYAKSNSGGVVDYLQADYVVDQLPSGFDLITLIYTDLCVLSPEQRSILLRKMRGMLNPGGKIVLDVAGMGLLNGRQEVTLIEDRLMGGFWAAGDYVGIQKSYLYDEQHLVLDRYVIVEPDETWQIYNWFQHYTPQMIETELRNSGFAITELAGDLTGKPLVENSDLMGIIATPC